MTGLGQIGQAGRALRTLLRVVCSVLCAGGTYFVWMATFIFLRDARMGNAEIEVSFCPPRKRKYLKIEVVWKA